MDFLMNLLPGTGQLAFQAVEIEPDNQQIVVCMTSVQQEARCPRCESISHRQHSQYVRTVSDLPWAEMSVVLRLEVGKWRCMNPDCEQSIFTERLPAVVRPWGRQTQRLEQRQTQLGLTVGGRAGSYLSGLLHSLTSRDTLIRLVRRQPLKEVVTPRVLGIDDWAKRKGQTYGTLLVDMDTHEVIDVLPERSAACVEQWLRDHPGVEIITRDRAGEYAAGARAGAPDALQVADRFHLMKNLGDTLTQALKQHSRELRTIGLSVSTPTQPVSNLCPVNQVESSAEPRTARQAHSLQKQAKRRELYEQVCALHEQGWMHKTIAAHLQLSSKTVSRWLAAGQFPERQSRTRPLGLLDPYKPYLRQRWAEGCRNGAQLRREIIAQGYPGKATQVVDFIAQLRRAEGLPARSHLLVPLAASDRPVLTPRALTSILFKEAEHRTTEQGQLLQAVTEQLPDVQPLLQVAQDFMLLVRQRLSSSLDAWLDHAAELRAFLPFVKGLRHDYAAVFAAVSTHFSNGQVEGQVNRLKFIKRQSYGRAKFDLLRRRVLLAGA
jgi:transposase